MEAMEVVLAEQRRGASGGAAVGEAYVGGDADGRGVNESLRQWRRFHLCLLLSTMTTSLLRVRP